MNSDRSIAIICMHTCPWQDPGDDDVGGMNVYVRQTAELLASIGWSVDIYTRTHSDIDDHNRLVQGVELFYIPAGPTGIPKEDLPSYVKPFVNVLHETVCQLKRKYCAILSHYWLSGLVGIELANRWQIPHIASFHTLALAKQMAFPTGNEPEGRISSERHIVETANHLLAVSYHEVEILTSRYGAHIDNVSIASPGVDRDQFQPRSQQEAKRKIGLPLDVHLLLAVGRIDPIKGFNILLQALAQIPNPKIMLMLVGGRADSLGHQNLKRLAKRLQIKHRVKYIDGVNQDILSYYYAASDACIIPSWYESFGLVALEALACGCPVVASRVGGLPYTLNGQALGNLVAPGVVGELSAQIQCIIDGAKNKIRQDNLIRPAAPDLSSWSTTTDAISGVLNQLTLCPG